MHGAAGVARHLAAVRWRSGRAAAAPAASRPAGAAFAPVTARPRARVSARLRQPPAVRHRVVVCHRLARRPRRTRRSGFQITFFRTRAVVAGAQPQRLRAAPAADRPLRDQRSGARPALARSARSGARVWAWPRREQRDTRVWIDDWRCERRGACLSMRTCAQQDFALDLNWLAPRSRRCSNGDAGLQPQGTRAAIAPATTTASRTCGQRQCRARRDSSDAVSGEAWLDHEWSSHYLDPPPLAGTGSASISTMAARSWHFGSATTRDKPYWSAATLRSADGNTAAPSRRRCRIHGRCAAGARRARGRLSGERAGAHRRAALRARSHCSMIRRTTPACPAVPSIGKARSPRSKTSGPPAAATWSSPAMIGRCRWR